MDPAKPRKQGASMNPEINTPQHIAALSATVSLYLVQRDSPMSSSKEPELTPRAVQLKAEGNAAFKSSEWSQAFLSFSGAISETPTSPSLYANRSAVDLKLQLLDLAVDDAKKAIEVTVCPITSPQLQAWSLRDAMLDTAYNSLIPNGTKPTSGSRWHTKLSVGKSKPNF